MNSRSAPETSLYQTMTADSADLPPVARLLEDGAWLHALARSVIADRATADDVAQDAAVVALTNPPRDIRSLARSDHRARRAA